MIIYPKQWQAELVKRSEALNAAIGSIKDDFDDFKFERSLYYIAICLRKLNDTSLRPPNFKFYDWQLDGNYYGQRIAAAPTHWWFSVDANFDMNKPTPGQGSFKDIVDMIIHSKFIDYSYGSRAIIVGSDRSRTNIEPSIFEFSSDKFIGLCEKVFKAKFNDMPPTIKSGAA